MIWEQTSRPLRSAIMAVRLPGQELQRLLTVRIPPSEHEQSYCQ